MKPAWIAIVAGGLLVSATVFAQATQPPAPMAIPATLPEMLPGDHGPLPLAMMLRTAPHEPAPPSPPDGTPAPPADAALSAARVAVDTCDRHGARIGVAVVDATGTLRAALSADGARGGAVFVATRKAAAAAAFGIPTSVLQARLRRDAAATATLKPYMAVSPGAVPLLSGGRVVGAIGGSGGTGEQDEACVAAGAASVAGLLTREIRP